jgi:electron transfer flavoprotein alpha subunit
MATVRPGVFPETLQRREEPIEVKRLAVDLAAAACPVSVVSRTRQMGVDVSRAERLVIAGAGVRGDMTVVEALAKALNAEIGATRVVIDRGWAERERQIGQTGVIARPKLAVVCGASGATQFTVGIEQADLVIALNQDREAPIFEQADVGVVDDLVPVLRALVTELESHNRGAI